MNVGTHYKAEEFYLLLKNSRKQISIFPMHAIQTLISINDMKILACLLKRSQENKRDFGNKKLSQKRDRQYLFMIIRFWTAVVPSLLTLSLPEYLMEFCKVSLTFEPVDQILWCDHSNETSLPVLSHDAIFQIFFQILENEIWKFGGNLPLATFGSERVKHSSTSETSLFSTIVVLVRFKLKVLRHPCNSEYWSC